MWRASLSSNMNGIEYQARSSFRRHIPIPFRIIEKLAEHFKNQLDKKISEVRLGLSYTAVKTESGVGLCYTMLANTKECCNVYAQAGKLKNKPVKYLIDNALKNSSSINLTLAVAALNSLNRIDEKDNVPDDIINLLDITKQDKVGMVGFFGPIIPDIMEKCAELKVIERNPEFKMEFVYKEKEAPEILNSSDVVIITATTILNNSLEKYLGYIRDAREVCILGPTTPLVPDIFKEWRVTLLSGFYVEDHQKALEIVSEGGGTKQLKCTGKKVNIRISK